MNSNSPNPITELVLRGENYQGDAVLFDISGERITIGAGDPKAELSMSADSLQRMIAKEVASSELFMAGELTIEGDFNAAIAVGAVLEADESGGNPLESAGTENNNIAYLDNVGLLVGDLHATRDRFEQLGFNLAERGTHYYENPPGTFTTWGTANHCVNFRDGGLLEFIAHYYPEHPAGLYGQQLEASGNHWGKITLHCQSADGEVARLKRQGRPTADASTLYRYIDGEQFSPDPKHSKKTLLFSYPTSFQDGFMMVGAEHTLGEFPISDAHYSHPNGAERMPFALIAAADLEGTVERYEQAVSIKSEHYNGEYRIALGRDTHLRFTASDALPPSIASLVADRPVACVGAGFEVRDLGLCKALLDERGFKTEETRWGLMVGEPIKGSGTVFFGKAR